jgi:hypothetical protein
MTQDLQGLFANGRGNKLMVELSSKQGKMGRRRSLVGVTNKVWITSLRKGTELGMLVSSLNKMKQFFFLCSPPH